MFCLKTERLWADLNMKNIQTINSSPLHYWWAPASPASALANLWSATHNGDTS